MSLFCNPFEYYPRIRLDVALRMFLYSSQRNARVVINLFISLFKDSAWEENENNLTSLPCSRQKNLCVGFGVITEKAPPTCLPSSQCWTLTIVLLTAERGSGGRNSWEQRERRLGLSGYKRGFGHRDHCFAGASQGTGGYSNIYKGRAVISPGDRVHLSVTTSARTQSPPACGHLLRSEKTNLLHCDLSEEE